MSLRTLAHGARSALLLAALLLLAGCGRSGETCPPAVPAESELTGDYLGLQDELQDWWELPYEQKTLDAIETRSLKWRRVFSYARSRDDTDLFVGYLTGLIVVAFTSEPHRHDAAMREVSACLGADAIAGSERFDGRDLYFLDTTGLRESQLVWLADYALRHHSDTVLVAYPWRVSGPPHNEGSAGGI